MYKIETCTLVNGGIMHKSVTRNRKRRFLDSQCTDIKSNYWFTFSNISTGSATKYNYFVIALVHTFTNYHANKLYFLS